MIKINKIILTLDAMFLCIALIEFTMISRIFQLNNPKIVGFGIGEIAGSLTFIFLFLFTCMLIAIKAIIPD